MAARVAARGGAGRTIAVPRARGRCCRKEDLDYCDKYDQREDDDFVDPLPNGKRCVSGKLRKG